MAADRKHAPQDRDLSQRSYGFIGLSAILHIGLLMSLVMTPSFKTLGGGSLDSSTVGADMKGTPSTEITIAGSTGGEASPGTDSTSGTRSESPSSEVLLADATDTNAVAVSPAELPQSQVQASASSPQQPAAPPVTPPPESKPVAFAKPELAVPKNTALKISTPAAKTREGDVAIKSALEESRKPKTVVETKTPVAKSEAESEPISELIVVEDSKEEAAEEEAAPSKSALVPKKEAVATEVASTTEAEPDDNQADEQTEATDQTKAEPIAATPSLETKLDAETEERHSLTPTARALLNTNSLPKSATDSSLLGGGGGGSSSGISLSALGSSGSGSTATNSTAPGAGTGATTQGGSPTGSQTAASSGAATAGIGQLAGQAVRDSSSLQAMPGNPRPAYPLQDKMARREGMTTLIGRVKEDGTMAEVMVEKSSGSRSLDESAAKAFKQWRYQPGQAGLIRYRTQFQLVGDATEVPTQLRRQ